MSRVDWGSMFNGDGEGNIERDQIWYERRHTVLRMREAGLTLKEIGNRIGKSVESVRRMEAKAFRENRRGFLSPVEKQMRSFARENEDFKIDVRRQRMRRISRIRELTKQMAEMGAELNALLSSK